MNEPRYCKDCKHSREEETSTAFLTCMHPKIISTSVRALARSTDAHMYGVDCDAERSYNGWLPKCGIRGKLWEARSADEKRQNLIEPLISFAICMGASHCAPVYHIAGQPCPRCSMGLAAPSDPPPLCTQEDLDALLISSGIWGPVLAEVLTEAGMAIENEHGCKVGETFQQYGWVRRARTLLGFENNEEVDDGG
ncbi:MAG: hypothetical protein KAY22_26520 [Rhizorhabdus sp.]|uniref:hypothetical protein n=1 Tax=Rhizorhabdus sp. TaxID=1968843 RepID=UPI001B777FF2|nr:hypothetical protein [Rhizorhabdus sp.]MBP8235854.1 hypothetical protein [Rhizorhabdus sp.]